MNQVQAPAWKSPASSRKLLRTEPWSDIVPKEENSVLKSSSRNPLQACSWANRTRHRQERHPCFANFNFSHAKLCHSSQDKHPSQEFASATYERGRNWRKLLQVCLIAEAKSVGTGPVWAARPCQGSETRQTGTDRPQEQTGSLQPPAAC